MMTLCSKKIHVLSHVLPIFIPAFIPLCKCQPRRTCSGSELSTTSMPFSARKKIPVFSVW